MLTKKPVGRKKKVITITLSPSVIKLVDAMARHEQRSRSNVIEVLLRQSVDPQRAA